MDKNDISTYLHKVFEIETSLFQQKKILEQLAYAKDNVVVGQYKEIEEVEHKKIGGDIWLCLSVHVAWFFVVIFWLCASDYISVNNASGNIESTFYSVIFSFFSFVGNIYNMFIGMGFNQDWASIITSIFPPCVIDIIIFLHSFLKYNKYVLRMKKYNNYVVHHNDQVLALRKIERDRIIYKIQDAERYYNETVSVLKKLYSIDIIYPKYQNLIAIGMFCEYFDSGRCSSLEGHEGAYNIYESELRQNIIIAKLDEIILKLDTVQQNQYFLYQAIQNSNQTIRMISNELLSKIDSIEQNQSLSTYYNGITARNTDILVWERLFSIK